MAIDEYFRKGMKPVRLFDDTETGSTNNENDVEPSTIQEPALEDTLKYKLQKEIDDLKNEMGKAIVILSDKDTGLALNHSKNISDSEADVLSSILEGKKNETIEHQIKNESTLNILERYEMQKFKDCHFRANYVTENVYLIIASKSEYIEKSRLDKKIEKIREYLS